MNNSLLTLNRYVIWACALLFCTFTFAQVQTFSLTEDSTASFTIEEVLLGNNKTVVGTSNGVQGEFSVDVADINSLVMQSIMVDATVFSTDNRRRNATLHSRILETEQFPTVSFDFGSISNIGVLDDGRVTAVVTGDVTIKEVVLEQTFDLTLNNFSQKTISGTASTTILYKDYGLNIPPVPMVASVEDEVLLQIEFVAQPTQPTATSHFTDFPVLALGETLYQTNCVACHSVNGEGYGNPEMPAPALNGTEHAWHHSDEQILGLIANGGPNMPAIGATWTQEEREAVWIYVKHWWPEDIRKTQPGDLGEALLAEYETTQN